MEVEPGRRHGEKLAAYCHVKRMLVLPGQTLALQNGTITMTNRLNASINKAVHDRLDALRTELVELCDFMQERPEEHAILIDIHDQVVDLLYELDQRSCSHRTRAVCTGRVGTVALYRCDACGYRFEIDESAD